MGGYNSNTDQSSFYKKDDFIYGINNRSEESFNALFYVYNRPLVKFANRYIGCLTDAEDVVHDVFLQFWEGEYTFADRNVLKSFLYTVTKNKAINFLKKKSKLHFDVSFLEYECNYEEPNNNFFPIHTEFWAFLDSALGQLPFECKKIMRLIAKGLATSEIAQKLGIAPSTVRAQKRRGISLIRDDYNNEIEKEQKITDLFLQYSKMNRDNNSSGKK
ncbi:MAG: sigma-70 family RNA polymerase sigma factor [Bacteroidales bacterium]|nr:sigma-70 family RNA polymerase sigma factor [Bacteroidales bacterium]MDD2425954.1 sigma-70 family RNA polymerase sigma factor [Bacteroidales bacterium]MDD3990181.1 sigma-70 family RNA polymerase sigma factor [Bacteroidales bacterium]